MSACGPTSIASLALEPSQTTAPPSSASAASATSTAPLRAHRPPVTTLASGEALPACEPALPDAADTVTFVASGYAWALAPSGGQPDVPVRGRRCGALRVGSPRRPGAPWRPGGQGRGRRAQPRGERPGVRLDHLEPADGESRSCTCPPPARACRRCKSTARPDLDVTPFQSSTYLSVTYHPSGEAFVFAVDQGGAESIWISSNTGKTPGRLVFTEEGTKFGAIAFDVDGRHLLYAAQHADDHADLHRIDITDPTKAPEVWSGPVGRMILDIKPGLRTGTVAWTTGTSCDDSVAMASVAGGNGDRHPRSSGPTRAVGWLSADAAPRRDGRLRRTARSLGGRRRHRLDRAARVGR